MKRVLVAFAGIALVAAGCSNSGDDDAGQTSSTNPTSAFSTTTTPTVETFAIGEAATNGGVKLTVNAVSTPPTIPMMTNSMKKNSGYDIYGDVAPRAGGKFVRVDATVENVGQKSMDLTCSWPVNVFAADADDRMFDPVDDLYKLEGTPECNENLQPGFASPMTYVFEVPQAADVRIFAFADTEKDSQDPTFVVISPQTGVTTEAPTPEVTSTIEAVPEPTFEAPAEPAPPAQVAPPTGYTAAPTGDPTALPGKEIAYCMDDPIYQNGTTMFTDGSTGWTEQCAGE